MRPRELPLAGSEEGRDAACTVEVAVVERSAGVRGVGTERQDEPHGPLAVRAGQEGDNAGGELDDGGLDENAVRCYCKRWDSDRLVVLE